jgi:hypothetical protein
VGAGVSDKIKRSTINMDRVRLLRIMITPHQRGRRAEWAQV